jgi:hypothetical protein
LVALLVLSPLFRFRALFRSSVVSCLTWFAVSFALGGVAAHKELLSFGNVPTILGIVAIIAYGLFMIATDYISLFVVRKCLLAASRQPLLSLLLSVIGGTCVIILTYLLLLLTLTTFVKIYLDFPMGFSQLVGIPLLFLKGKFLMIMTPSIMVHFWLLLFGAGAVGVRVIGMIFRAVEGAQWFLKQGNRHPLRAIGMVAAALVFVISAIGKAVGMVS